VPVSEKNKIQVLSIAKEILSSRLRYNEAMAADLANSTAAELKDFFYTLNFSYRDHINSLNSNITELEPNLFAWRDQLFSKAIPADIEMLRKLLDFTDAVMHDKASLLSLLYAVHLFLNNEDQQMQIAKKLLFDRSLQLRKQKEAAATSEAAQLGYTGKAAHAFIKRAVKLMENEERLHKYDDRARFEFYFIKDITDLIDSIAEPAEQKFVGHYVELFETDTEYFYVLNSNFKNDLERGCAKIKSLLIAIDQLSLAYEVLKDQLKSELTEIFEKNNSLNVTIADCNLRDPENLEFLRVNSMDMYQFWVESQTKVVEINKCLQEAKDEEAKYNLQQQYARQEKERHAAKEEKLRQEIERQAAKAAKTRQARDHQSAKEETVRLEKEKEAKLEKLKQLEKGCREQAAAEIVKTEAVRKQNITFETNKRKAAIEAQRVRSVQEKRQSMINAISETKVVKQVEGKLVSPYQFKAETIEKCSQDLIDLFSPLTKRISFSDAVTLIGRLGGKVEANKHGSSHHAITFEGNIYTYFGEQIKSEVTAGGLPRPHNGETDLYRFELNLLREAIESLLPDGWVEQELSTQKQLARLRKF
jgi:hypothetical protein